MRILYSEDCEKAVNIFIHKLIDPHIKMLFNKAIDTLDCWYEIDKKSNESVMFMDNCIELIKIINMKYYDDLAEILTYILIHNDIFYYFVFHTFEIGERKSIR